MAFSSSRGGVPPTPTLPTGVQIASFDTYLEAQRAVDLLSDKEFEVQHTTIVGTDLRMVERITGRLSYPRVALAGAMSGAWFGLFVGLLFGLLSEGSILIMLLPALVIGAAFGMLFALVSYAFTGGKRDFTSSSQVVASRYGLLCEQSRVGEALRLLNEAGIRARVGADLQPAGAPGWQPRQPPGPYGARDQQGVPAPQPPDRPGATSGPAQEPRPAEAPRPSATPDEPEAPARGFTPWEDEHGNPRYGRRRPDSPQDGGEPTP
ncbi:general stress protein [Georgenia sp. H159]|uniref:general stress protein n=1 Tax=Georgenia sp. H159 TaxID=3076115 RepID=UPI002D78D050|nr:general stress protein [Georgenia sp. H159]